MFISDTIMVHDLCTCFVFAVCHYCILLLLRNYTLVRQPGPDLATKLRQLDSDGASSIDGVPTSADGADAIDKDAVDTDAMDDEDDFHMDFVASQQGPCGSAGLALLEQYGVFGVPPGVWDASKTSEEHAGAPPRPPIVTNPRRLLEHYGVLGAPPGAWDGGGGM